MLVLISARKSNMPLQPDGSGTDDFLSDHFFVRDALPLTFGGVTQHRTRRLMDNVVDVRAPGSAEVLDRTPASYD